MTNVLAPVPVGGTHIEFWALLLDPCWMALAKRSGSLS